MFMFIFTFIIIYIYITGSRSSIVGIATMLQPVEFGVPILVNVRSFCVPCNVKTGPRGPPSLLFNGHRRSLTAYSRQGVKLTTRTI